MGPGCISHLVGQSSCFQADFFKGIVSLKLVSPVSSIELLFLSEVSASGLTRDLLPHNC